MQKPAKKTKSARVFFTYEGKRYSCRGATLAEANQKVGALRLSLERGEIGISGKMTVRRWTEEWLETYKKPDIGYGAYIDYVGRIKVINNEIGSMSLKSVNDTYLKKVLNLTAGKSKPYITKMHQTICAIFKQAYRSRLISNDPSEYLTMPVGTVAKRRSITPVERKHVLSVAETHRAGLWICIMLYAGLRPAECRALDWRHVDFKARMIHVRAAMKHMTRDIGKPKSAAGVRDIPMKDELHDMLLKHKGDPFAPVLMRKTGIRHTASSMKMLWRSFERALDISMGAKTYRNKVTVHAVAPDLVPYCLRHTYCTDLQDAGVPINVARYLMGHADISTTAKVYTDTTDKTLADVSKKINATASTKRYKCAIRRTASASKA